MKYVNLHCPKCGLGSVRAMHGDRMPFLLMNLAVREHRKTKCKGLMKSAVVTMTDTEETFDG